MSEAGQDANETWQIREDASYLYKDGNRYGPGDTFRPTRRQVENQTLTHKARKVTEHSPPTQHSGADIGLRTLEWGSQAALRAALDAGLGVGDFEGREPSGATGYVKSDVDAVLEANA